MVVWPRLRLARLVAPVVALAPSVSALASPASDPTTGRAVFTGPTEPHPSSIELNPGALGLGLPGLHIYLSGSGTFDQIGIDRQIADPAVRGKYDDGPSLSLHTLSWGSQAALWYVRPAGLPKAVGISVLSRPAEVFPGDPVLRYHTTGGRYRESSITGFAAVQPVSRVHFGASLGLVFDSRLTLNYDRDTALEGRTQGYGASCDAAGTPCGFENPDASEHYHVYATTPRSLDILSTNYIVLSAGAVVRVPGDWWVALAYRSPQGFGSSLKLNGSASIECAPRDVAAGVCHRIGDQLDAPAIVAIDLPQSVLIGARGPIVPGLDFVGGFRFEDLARVRDFDVRLIGCNEPNRYCNLREAGIPDWQPRPRGLRNVYAAWAGVEQVDAGERFRFGGRIGAESGAVDARHISPLQVYGHQVTADVGAQIRILPELVLQLDYGVAFYPEVDSTDSAYDPHDYLDCVAGNYDYDLPACAAVRAGYAGATGAGRYRRLDHAARLGIRYDLP